MRMNKFLNWLQILPIVIFLPVCTVSARAKCSGLFPIPNDSSTVEEMSQLNKQWGLIDCKGRVVIPPIYSKAFEFSDGIAVLTNANESILVSQDGSSTRLPGIQVKTAFAFGSAIGEVGGKIYSIDKRGSLVKELFDAKYCYTDPCFLSSFFENGYVLANTKDGPRYISKYGKFLKLRPNESPGHFNDGVAVVDGENGFGVIDEGGNIIVPLTYKNAILDSSEGLLTTREETATIYIDHTGKHILSVDYDYAGRFSESLAEIKSGQKWGFMDKSGKIIIKPQFDEVKEFSEGLAAAQQNLKWGFISKTGSFKISPVFDLVRPFQNGLAYVRDEKQEGYVNKAGRWIWKKDRFEPK